MFRKFIAAAAVAIAMLAGSVTFAPTASADTEGCVTRAEFRSVRNGWSADRVHRVFDTNGRQTYFYGGGPYSNPSQGRDYRACVQPRYSLVSVDYEKRRGVWRVTGKFAYWA